MLNVQRVVDEIESVRKSPHLHVQPVTPETLYRHFMSLSRGVMLSTDTLSPGDFINARREANRFCGWESCATSPAVEMREKGMSDEQIIIDLIDIEIRM